MEKFACSECSNVYFYYKNLRKHVRKIHPDKISEIAPIKKSNKIFNYKCNICDRQFNHIYNFQHHQRTVHYYHNSVVLKGRKFKKLKCPLCAEAYSLKKTLFAHIESYHSINLTLESLQFATFEDFHNWKSNVEFITFSKYVKEHGSKRDNSIVKHYYVCHRSGNYNPEGKGQRKLKSQGSQKINGICPASMSVNEYENGECKVQYLSTHVGHNLDVRHLYLTENERQHLATKIANKTPFQTIIEDVRNKTTDPFQFRFKRLKKKDLYNIQRRLNASVEANNFNYMAVEIKKKFSVLFCKLPDEVDNMYPKLESKDFVLIIMNNRQCDSLKKYGSDFICVDMTSKLNSDNYELITLLTFDENRHTYPCAFMISNRSDEYVFGLFFDVLKARTGKLSASVFMSGFNDLIYSSWVTIMGDSKIKHFCTWDVLNNWENNLSKITNINKQIDTLQTLKALLYKQDSDGFEIKFKIIVQQFIEDPETVDFGRYLSEHFVKNISCWALCYRYKDIMGINVSLERVHETLTHLCSENKYQSLHLTVQSILDFLLKIFPSDLIKVEPKNCNEITTEQDIQRRHDSSLELPTDMLIEVDEEGWKIQSVLDADEVFFIRTYLPNCSCKYLCRDCNECIHKFVCTCLDSYLKWNMCIHVHIICHFLNSQSNTEPGKLFLNGETFSVPFESEVVISESGEIIVQFNKNDDVQLPNILEINAEDKCVDEIDKEKIKGEFIELLNNITTENELEIVRESMSTLKALLDSRQTQTISIDTSNVTEN